jgi:basic amino acid/polyamine antiporter, APA family
MAQSTARPKVFVRQSSGLIREFSLLDVVNINLAGVTPPVGMLLSLTGVAAIWPGTNLVVLICLGAIASAATVITYGFMSAAMPRSGGDYVFVGRTTWPWLGFLANWMMTLSLFVLFGILTVGITSTVIVPGFTAFGFVTGNSSVVTAAANISSSKTATFIVALIFLIIPIIIALMGDRWIKNGFRTFISVAIVGTILAGLVMLFSSHADFTSRMNALLSAHGDGSLTKMHAAALAAKFHPVHYFSWSQTLAALPFGFFALVGLTYSTYVGGEIQRPQRNQPLGMAITLVLAGIIYIFFFAEGYRVFGWDNIHSWAFLANNNPAALTFPGGTPWYSFLVGALTRNGLVSFLIALAFVAWYLTILLFCTIMPVRNMFAWSMDRVFPEVISTVNRNGTPWVATVIVGAGAIVVAIIAIYTNIIQIFVNYTFMYAITFLLSGIGAALFPFTRKDLWNSAPEISRSTLLGIPWVTIAGIVQIIVFLLIIYETLKTPAFSPPTGTKPTIAIICMIILGPIVFFGSRAIRKSQGIDMDAVWATLPPD